MLLLINDPLHRRVGGRILACQSWDSEQYSPGRPRLLKAHRSYMADNTGHGGSSTASRKATRCQQARPEGC